MNRSQRRKPRVARRGAAPAAALDSLHNAGAGRWWLHHGWLQADAQAQALLGLPARRVRLSVGWPLPDTSALDRLQAALGNTASPLALELPGPQGPVLMRGSATAEGWAGLVLALPPQGAARLKARDEFVASLGHELRTPLNAILGFARLARAEGQPHTHLGPIDEAAQLMLRVVNDLLDLAQLEAGRLDIEPDQPLDLPALLARAARLTQPLCRNGQVRLSTRIDPACPTSLRGDGQRIEQVLVNLLGNATKFTDRGEVVLGVRLRLREADQVTLRLSVSDTGVGMPLEQLQRLGQPFERSVDSRGGTGLGLAVVRRLLELHGTRLQVASVPGGGTTMWFDLTLALGLPGAVPVPAADPAAALRIDPLIRGCHLLVVDDNPMNVQVLQQMLACMGATTRSAATAHEALVLAATEHFDAALLDVELGADNGLRLATQLRELPGHAALPVVILSAHVNPQLRLQAQALGALACLGKPYEPSELQTALRGLTRAPTRPAIPLLALFQAAWPAHRAALDAAQQPAELCSAVHALRGSLAFLPDPAARQLARQLEEGLRAGLPVDRARLDALRQAAERLAQP